MHVFKANFNGTPNVGLYGYATDTYLLLGESLTKKLQKQVQNVLGDVDIHHVIIAGTTMPGLFMVGNSSCVLVPGITFQNELKIFEKLNVPYKVLETRHTCLGNNIVCNDHGAVISTEFTEKERKFIEKSLSIPAVRLDIAGMTSPGSFIVVNGSNGIIHRDATPEEIATVEKTLHVTLTQATANLGTPYLNASILNNSHGFIIGDASGGPEIVHIDEALGYMEEDA